MKSIPGVNFTITTQGNLCANFFPMLIINIICSASLQFDTHYLPFEKKLLRNFGKKANSVYEIDPRPFSDLSLSFARLPIIIPKSLDNICKSMQ
jgi:hypothetical protein